MLSKKACTKCGLKKPLDAFYKDARHKDGLCSSCKKCHAKCQKVNPEQQRKASRKYAQRHPERIRARNRSYIRRNPEKKKRWDRQYHLRRQYGITIADYEQLLQASGGCCWLCGTADPVKNKYFHVDHDHSTGAVRGLLCAVCNGYIIGRMEKRGVTPDLITAYLTNDRVQRLLGQSDNK